MEIYSQYARKVVEDIKAIKIQGARNVAKAAAQALIEESLAFDANTKEELLNHLLKFRRLLLSLRPTEPMTRNLLESLTRHILSLASSLSLDDLKNHLKDRESEELLKELDESFNKMLENGSNYLPDGSTVITICHSSSVTNVIKKAKEKGKSIHVISCETRPLYQGRITARELSEAGIKVTSIVDSAAASMIKKADLAIVGADAITSVGDLYNKIGTRMLASLAYDYDIPFISVAELFKYDPATLFGAIEPIEQRDPREVWKDAPEGVEVLNPAFDRTPAKYISSYICEKGVVPPQQFGLLFEETYKP